MIKFCLAVLAVVLAMVGAGLLIAWGVSRSLDASLDAKREERARRYREDYRP